MIKRIIVSIVLLLCLCVTAMANKELSIKLDANDRVRSERLGYAYLTFEYFYAEGNNAKVKVYVENITNNPPLAVLIFDKDMTEQALKKGKPKIEFEKTYPGKKGTRIVKGCKESKRDVNIIPATCTDTIFMIDVPFSSSKDFTLPLYEAKYKANDLFKKAKSLFNKGAYNINYKILEEHIYNINIQVVGWSEDDPTYVEVKKDVKNFISSLDEVKFCSNKKHSPSLKEQQRPYQEKKDSLSKNINEILDHSEWLSTDAPHKAYTQLLSELNQVNLNDKNYDCGQHKIKYKGHNCGYCSLSQQKIYQRLDDLYQQLYAGKINKNQALKTAKGLYNCFQQNKRRKNDSSYGAKISRFYNSIANY